MSTRSKKSNVTIVEKKKYRSFFNQSVRIHDWNHFFRTCQLLSDGESRWVFRGQGDSSWPLSTTFERAAIKREHSPACWAKIEYSLLQEFKRSAHHYVQHLPMAQNYIQWFSMIQHYGGPTRMLDFTKSPYIAAFHALSGNHDADYFSIWAINRQKIENIIRSFAKGLGILNQNGQKIKISDNTMSWLSTYVYSSQKAENICNFYIEQPLRLPLILLIEPTLLNQRMAVQQGLFVMQTALDAPFSEKLAQFLEMVATIEIDKSDKTEDNLKSLYESRWNKKKTDRFIIARAAIVLRLDISWHLRASFMEQLDHMNINMYSLFPGVEGYTKHMSRLLEKWNHDGNDNLAHIRAIVKH